MKMKRKKVKKCEVFVNVECGVVFRLAGYVRFCNFLLPLAIFSVAVV